MDSVGNSALSYDSAAVHAHLGHLQGIIGRMSASSHSCKFWCVALISAVLVILGLGREPSEPVADEQVLLAALPAVVMLLLNMYYHSQELRFRDAYNDFVKDLHAGQVHPEALFEIGKGEGAFCRWLRSVCSFSILPFYIMIGLIVFLAWKVIL